MEAPINPRVLHTSLCSALTYSSWSVNHLPLLQHVNEDSKYCNKKGKECHVVKWQCIYLPASETNTSNHVRFYQLCTAFLLKNSIVSQDKTKVQAKLRIRMKVLFSRMPWQSLSGACSAPADSTSLKHYTLHQSHGALLSCFSCSSHGSSGKKKNLTCNTLPSRLKAFASNYNEHLTQRLQVFWMS